MFEKIAIYISDFFSGFIIFMKNAVNFFFYDLMGISDEGIRLLSIVLILSTFSFLIIMTLIFYFRSILSVIREAKNLAVLGLKRSENNKMLIAFIEESLKETEKTQKTKKKKDRKKSKNGSDKERDNEDLDLGQVLVNDNFEFLSLLSDDENSKKALKHDINNLIDIDENPAPQSKNKQDKKTNQEPVHAQKAEESKYKEHIKIKAPYRYNIGLILDMIGRGVTEFKAAQSIYFRTNYTQPQEQVLQIVNAVKEFASFCKQGVFKNIKKPNGPDESSALEGIVRNDPSDAIQLLLDLMEKEANRADKIENKKKKESLYKRLSDTSCLCGTLSGLYDPILATKAFEMAIELNPDNVKAWSRAADIYYETERFERAVKIYELINANGGDENKQQVANAKIMMAKYHYSQENIYAAQKLREEGSIFYKELSIGTDLNEREKEVLEFIESNRIANIKKTISRLLDA